MNDGEDRSNPTASAIRAIKTKTADRDDQKDEHSKAMRTRPMREPQSPETDRTTATRDDTPRTKKLHQSIELIQILENVRVLESNQGPIRQKSEGRGTPANIAAKVRKTAGLQQVYRVRKLARPGAKNRR